MKNIILYFIRGSRFSAAAAISNQLVKAGCIYDHGDMDDDGDGEGELLYEPYYDSYDTSWQGSEESLACFKRDLEMLANRPESTEEREYRDYQSEVFVFYCADVSAIYAEAIKTIFKNTPKGPKSKLYEIAVKGDFASAFGSDAGRLKQFQEDCDALYF